MKPAVHAHVPHIGLSAFLALVIGMTLSCPAHGGAGVWTSGGPNGEDVAAIAASPAGMLYAGMHLGGVFRSTDGGATWAPVNEGLRNLNMLALAMDATATTLYAGLSGGSVWQLRAPPAKGDLNGDGQPDLVFRGKADGTRNKVWFMDGVRRTSEEAVGPDARSADWSIRGVDDFDGDGQSDLAFWNGVSGQVEFWLMSGAVRLGAAMPLTGGPILDPAWELSAARDFNRNDRPGLVWRSMTSQKLLIWTMNGTVKASQIVPTPDQAVDANWAIVAALDYNDDGNTDLLWYNSTSGKIVTWYMDASVVRISGQFTTPDSAGNNNVPGTPPLGSPDVVWRNENSGNQVVWHMDFASRRVHGEFTNPPAITPALDWTAVGPR